MVQMLQASGRLAHCWDLYVHQACRKLQDSVVVSAKPHKENLRHVLLVFLAIRATLVGETVLMEQELQSCILNAS